jgi:hypothetical protein
LFVIEPGERLEAQLQLTVSYQRQSQLQMYQQVMQEGKYA